MENTLFLNAAQGKGKDKNYSAWSIRKISLTTIQNPSDYLIRGHQTFKNQFLAYLGKIPTMNSFAYYFKARSGVNATTVKTEFRALMLTANNNLSQDERTVFNTIWNNLPLRDNLFPRINYPGKNDTQYREAAQQDFDSDVANISNPFYNFIKVQ